MDSILAQNLIIILLTQHRIQDMQFFIKPKQIMPLRYKRAHALPRVNHGLNIYIDKGQRPPIGWTEQSGLPQAFHRTSPNLSTDQAKANTQGW